MLKSKTLNELVFLDIETVPAYKSFFELSYNMQKVFMRRFKKDFERITGKERDHWDLEEVKRDEALNLNAEELYRTKAPLQPEFLNICCISVGYFETVISDEANISADLVIEFKTKSFFGTDEIKILKQFYNACGDFVYTMLGKKAIVAHNGLNFDFPVIAKRTVLNKLPLPIFFDFAGKKPWEIKNFIDTKEEWRFGVYDANVSLELLCEVFGIPSSKDDIDGSQVRDVFYEQGDVKRIAIYCAKDVHKNAEVYLMMKGIYNKVNHSEL